MSELKFEGALARLEEIVRSLELGEAALDEALVLFEEGVKLARFCNQQLDQAQAKIEIMMNDGKIETFEVSDV
jgi:exodeoxyribonuclease VII small subunit